MPLLHACAAITIPLVLGGCGGSATLTSNPGSVRPNDPQTPEVTIPIDNPENSRYSLDFDTPTGVDVYVPLEGTGIDAVVSDIFAQDLNNDSVDEVIIGGRLTQPNTAETWRTTNLQLYGWNTGSFANETATWFRGTNNIIGTEPSVKFGDFNGDGNIDMFTAPSTDMNTLYGKAVVFSSNGSSFSRSEIPVGNTWAHDSWVGDLNGDGRDDIVMLDYGNNVSLNYGNADGTFDTYTGESAWGGSGISIADYLGNGTMTMIISDATKGSAGGDNDTVLFSIDTSSGNLELTDIAKLPASRFTLPKYANDRTQATWDPHAIRNFAMDFSGDGLVDVVVMDYLSGNGVYKSELQFLRNNGNGSFTDVTDDVLINWDTNGNASYQPIFMDVNSDGLTDIFMSSSDYGSNGIHDGTRVLVQSSDGKFVQMYEDVFSDFYSQITNATDNSIDWRQPINIVQGPGGEKYLASTVIFNVGNNIRAKTYLAKINESGRAVVQTAEDIIRTEWPYLSDAQVNNILTNVEYSSFNGIMVEDAMSALSPAGGLGILTQDGTSRVRLSGNISVPGLDLNTLANVQAIDAFGRNYRVDMSSLGLDYAPQLNIDPVGTQTQSWMTNYVSTDYKAQGIWAFGDSDQYSISANNTILNTEWQYGISHTLMDTSPWMAFDGVFGDIENTDTLEINLGKAYQNGTWHQIGLMHTTTNFTPGLVQSVSDIESVYAVLGYRNKKWDVQTGLQPLIVSGKMSMSLPTNVDKTGNLQYTDYTVNVRNKAELFLNATRSYSYKFLDVHLNGNITSLGNNGATLTVESKF